MTLKMAAAQVVETSVTVTNSSFQNYTHPDEHTRQTTDTPGFKPFTMYRIIDTWHLSQVMMERGPQSTRTSHASRATTGETASHYQHLKFEWSCEEGRALVNSYQSYESYN